MRTIIANKQQHQLFLKYLQRSMLMQASLILLFVAISIALSANEINEFENPTVRIDAILLAFVIALYVLHMRIFLWQPYLPTRLDISPYVATGDPVYPFERNSSAGYLSPFWKQVSKINLALGSLASKLSSIDSQILSLKTLNFYTSLMLHGFDCARDDFFLRCTHSA